MPVIVEVSRGGELGLRETARRAGPTEGPAAELCSEGLAIAGYWITEAPEGLALSLPPEPIEAADCQIVPVVFVKK
jgi:hypothetical protein